MEDLASIAQPIPGLASHVLPLMLIWLHEDPVQCPSGHRGVVGSRSRCRHQAYQIPADGLAFLMDLT